LSRGYNVAVVGATGAVGEEMLKILLQRDFPVRGIRALASERSEGTTLEFGPDQVKVERLTPSSFKEIEIALFSAGTSISKEFSPIAARAGAVVVDNSAAFRMDPATPLVVPEVNPQAVRNHKGIIANPNCSTIQMVVVIYPIHRVSRIRRIIVSTYQAVSGTGREAPEELRNQTHQWVRGDEITREVYPHQIAFNLLPHIGEFLPNGYTSEEMKMLDETRKIMQDGRINITATCVRVPVFCSHSEAVTIETERRVSAEEAREILSHSPGVLVQDDPQSNIYPLPIEAEGKDEVFVGRIREDGSRENSLMLWIVSDNLRKGAALNAIQIAELLIRENLL